MSKPYLPSNVINAINSMLYLKCAGEHSTGDRMPQGSPNYFDNNPDKLQLIYDWINFGCIE